MSDGIAAPVSVTLNIEVVAPTDLLLVNHSFEDGSAVTGSPVGWTLTDGSGTALGVGAGGSDGTQLLWIGPNAEMTQDLTHTLAENEALTLQYDSSRGANYARSVQLLAKNGGSYQLMAETTEQIGSGNWSTVLLNYTVAPQYAGQQLAIRVLGDNSNDADGDDWNEFDNFRITSAAPLPDSDDDGLPDTSDPDDDNDLIPDAWETANGLDPLVNDTTLDVDGDGFDNWAEYVTDTRPNDANSKQIFSAELDPETSEPTLRFSTSSNRRYRVYFSEDLSENSWLPLKAAELGTGAEMTISDSIPITTKRFYRLQIDLP